MPVFGGDRLYLAAPGSAANADPGALTDNGGPPMASSPDDAHPVEPDPPSPPKTRVSNNRQGGDQQPGYSPVILVVDVVRLLRGRGVAASSAVDQLHEAVEASTDLLLRLGVDPDKRLITKLAEHSPEIHAAAVLLRAAGIEPSAVVSWPARSS